jgi:hypothetical protein
METDIDIAMVVDTDMNIDRDIYMAWTVDIDKHVLKR